LYIGNDQVCALRGGFNPFFTIFGLDNGMTVPLQQGAQQQPHVRIVIDDQNIRHLPSLLIARTIA
jgi:hypothetical protein